MTAADIEKTRNNIMVMIESAGISAGLSKKSDNVKSTDEEVSVEESSVEDTGAADTDVPENVSDQEELLEEEEGSTEEEEESAESLPMNDIPKDVLVARADVTTQPDVHETGQDSDNDSDDEDDDSSSNDDDHDDLTVAGGGLTLDDISIDPSMQVNVNAPTIGATTTVDETLTLLDPVVSVDIDSDSEPDPDADGELLAVSNELPESNVVTGPLTRDQYHDWMVSQSNLSTVFSFEGFLIQQYEETLGELSPSPDLEEEAEEDDGTALTVQLTDDGIDPLLDPPTIQASYSITLGTEPSTPVLTEEIAPELVEEAPLEIPEGFELVEEYTELVLLAEREREAFTTAVNNLGGPAAVTAAAKDWIDQDVNIIFDLPLVDYESSPEYLDGELHRIENYIVELEEAIQVYQEEGVPPENVEGLSRLVIHYQNRLNELDAAGTILESEEKDLQVVTAAATVVTLPWGGFGGLIGGGLEVTNQIDSENQTIEASDSAGLVLDAGLTFVPGGRLTSGVVKNIPIPVGMIDTALSTILRWGPDLSNPVVREVGEEVIENVAYGTAVEGADIIQEEANSGEAFSWWDVAGRFVRRLPSIVTHSVATPTAVLGIGGHQLNRLSPGNQLLDIQGENAAFARAQEHVSDLQSNYSSQQETYSTLLNIVQGKANPADYPELAETLSLVGVDITDRRSVGTYIGEFKREIATTRETLRQAEVDFTLHQHIADKTNGLGITENYEAYPAQPYSQLIDPNHVNPQLWSRGISNDRELNFQEHADKHIENFSNLPNGVGLGPITTAEEYRESLIYFIEHPPEGTLLRVVPYRSTVDGVPDFRLHYYNEALDTFAIVNSNGTPVTFYRLDEHDGVSPVDRFFVTQ